MNVSKKLQRKLLSGVSAGALVASLGAFDVRKQTRLF